MKFHSADTNSPALRGAQLSQATAFAPSVSALFCLRHASRIKDHAAKVPRGDANIREAVFLHQSGQLLRRREPCYGAGQVGVGFAAAGNRAADAGKNLTEIKSEQCREWSRTRFGELQDSSFPSTP